MQFKKQSGWQRDLLTHTYTRTCKHKQISGEGIRFLRKDVLNAYLALQLPIKRSCIYCDFSSVNFVSKTVMKYIWQQPFSVTKMRMRWRYSTLTVNISPADIIHCVYSEQQFCYVCASAYITQTVVCVCVCVLPNSCDTKHSMFVCHMFLEADLIVGWCILRLLYGNCWLQNCKLLKSCDELKSKSPQSWTKAPRTWKTYVNVLGDKEILCLFALYIKMNCNWH